ncbi:sesquipedalian-1-like [Cololabis saira]|uniref:sesquipedalian-1-like n=1 Tax=Cololabis saira TaxID=129043 RepID=UPI002AD4C53F|nr:sesquipedalian-1-like [Cololabis saira]
MKIDEKVLTYFESCNSPVDKEGYLSKKGEIKTSYQKRWFVLKGNLLFYKDRQTDRDLVGVIVVEGCTVQLCESEEQFAFSLVWSEPGLRTYKFAAEDQASQESWIKALLSANHSYLALLLVDMEKKYRDTLRAYSSEPNKTFTMPNFNTTEADYQAACLSMRASTLSSYPQLAAGAGAGPGFNQLLRPPVSPPRAASKKSPKMWAKKNANVVLANSSALPAAEWSGVEFCLGDKEDFSKLHEDFGKEVKELIAQWSNRAHIGEAVQGGNLIDFG